MKKVFIAIPYNHPDEAVKEYRLKTIKSYCIKMFEEDNAPVSALLMGLTLAEHGGLPTDTVTWLKYCMKLVSRCDEVHVLMVPDWEKSVGVADEIRTAESLGINVNYITID